MDKQTMQDDDEPVLHEKAYPFWARMVERAILFAVFFCIPLVFLGFVLFEFSYRTSLTYWATRILQDSVPSELHWLLLGILAVCVLSGIFGPRIYAAYVQRDRGKLHKIKSMENVKDSQAELARKILEDGDEEQ